MSGFSYQEYANRNPNAGQQRHGEAETGYYDELMPEAEWNKLTPKQQWEILMYGPGDTEALEGDAAAFQQKFGKGSWDANISGRPEMAGKYITGYGNPGRRFRGTDTDDGTNFADFAIDPSRVLVLDDGRWIVEADNVKGDWLAQKQAKWNAKRDKATAIAITIVTLAATAGAAGWLPTGAESAVTTGAAEGATALGGDALAGTEIVNTYAAGANPANFYVPGGVGNAIPTAAEASTVIPGGSQAAIPGGSQLPAPVVDSVAAVPGTNNGIINNALMQGRTALNTAGQWYRGLSPASRFILGQAVSQGANALIGASAQREAQQAANEREDQEREDRRRRTAIPDFSGAFKPRGNSKTGIIDGLRRPGGS